jgi:hypothetical protein
MYVKNEYFTYISPNPSTARVSAIFIIATHGLKFRSFGSKKPQKTVVFIIIGQFPCVSGMFL